MLCGGVIGDVTSEIVDEKRVFDFKPTAKKEVRIEPGSSLPAFFLTRVILVLASSGYLSFVAWANDKRQQVFNQFLHDTPQCATDRCAIASPRSLGI